MARNTHHFHHEVCILCHSFLALAVWVAMGCISLWADYKDLFPSNLGPCALRNYHANEQFAGWVPFLNMLWDLEVAPVCSISSFVPNCLLEWWEGVPAEQEQPLVSVGVFFTLVAKFAITEKTTLWGVSLCILQASR
jgi:hypothetical protein